MDNVNENKIWKYIVYFIIYSFIGYFLETAFGVITKGVVESRQSFLFGPFCAIYGIGACFMIYFLTKYRGKPFRIFFYSCIIGTCVEFLMSYFCEKMFHFKWWDYSEMKFNIFGRTCLYFSTMWGVLGIILIQFFNPLVNQVVNWLKGMVNINILKICVSFLVAFLVFDAGISYVGLKSFYAKIVNDHDLDLRESEYPGRIISNSLFEEDNMLLVYPNLQIAGTKYNNTYVDSLYKNKKVFYFRVFSKK